MIRFIDLLRTNPLSQACHRTLLPVAFLQQLYNTPVPLQCSRRQSNFFWGGGGGNNKPKQNIFREKLCRSLGTVWRVIRISIHPSIFQNADLCKGRGDAGGDIRYLAVVGGVLLELVADQSQSFDYQNVMKI